MANGDSTKNHNIPEGQDSQKERLFDPTATPLRFATHKANMATPNQNQDRRNVEQWQLDNTNAQHEEMISYIHHQQDEIDELKCRIARIDAVQDTVEGPAATEQEAVHSRSSPHKSISFLWLIFDLSILLLLVVGICYLVKNPLFDDWNYLGYFLDLLDIDYPHFF